MLSLGEAPDSGETLTFDLPTFVDINIDVGCGLWSPGAVLVQHLIALYIHTGVSSLAPPGWAVHLHPLKELFFLEFFCQEMKQKIFCTY